MALFMEVTDEQRRLAQQARAYGEQMQALTDTNSAKRKVCQRFFVTSLFYVVESDIMLCASQSVK